MIMRRNVIWLCILCVLTFPTCLIAQLGQGPELQAPDCNDPDTQDFACAHPRADLISGAISSGYKYYIGHAEPTAEFFSIKGSSGNNMQWKFTLPATDPSPTQNGNNVANFELFITPWIGLALCDPNSNPFGACVANSDTNNSATAGAGFLELQFFPPGINCTDSTNWCVLLHINTLQNGSNFQKNNCFEPTTAQYVTIDGVVGHTQLKMASGDTILVTIHDTTNGLEADVNDITSTATGSMIASGANGFVHNQNGLAALNNTASDCATSAFNFHPMFATASPGQGAGWTALFANVAFDFEIGHWELCSDATCSNGPPDADDGPGKCKISAATCNKPSDCPGTGDFCQNGCGTVRGVGGCFNSDTDHNGTSYLADWPDGTVAHPASLILGAPDDKGVGPLFPSSSPNTYDEGYTRIKFVTTEATNFAFYPFFSQAGTGSSCVFNFGNDIPNVTTNDFGKAAQYGTTINNPCLPGSVIPTTLTYTGPTSGDYHDPVTLSGTLTISGTSQGINAQTITFSVGTQNCSGVTNAAGVASCSPPIILNQVPGPYTVTASFAASGNYAASSASAAFTITKEETTTTYTGPTVIANGVLTTFSALLLEDGDVTKPIAGRTITITLGTGGTAQTCSGTTAAAGTATCQIPVNQPLGAGSVAANFAGDAFYLPSSASANIILFAFLARGAFVLGDQTATGAVEFWGDDWAIKNVLSGGLAPNAFKGFAAITTEPPACGSIWTTRPGNSPPPPAPPLPSFMGVVVSSAIGMSGPNISGNVAKIVVVTPNPGYAQDPGNHGTGTVVAVFCK